MTWERSLWEHFYLLTLLLLLPGLLPVCCSFTTQISTISVHGFAPYHRKAAMSSVYTDGLRKYELENIFGRTKTRPSTVIESSSIKAYFNPSPSSTIPFAKIAEKKPVVPVAIPHVDIPLLESKLAINEPNNATLKENITNSSMLNFTFPSGTGGNKSDINSIIDTNDQYSDLLCYLGTPEQIMRIPPQTRDLLRRITYNYIYGPSTAMVLSLQEIATIIELEHRSRDVPVQIVDVTNTGAVLFIADVTKTGEAFDELCAEILSIGALYQLPKEIVQELLSSMPQNVRNIDGTSTATFDYTTNSYSMFASSMNKCRSAFATTGWDGVTFPLGLAIRPKTKFRSIWSFPLLRNNGRDSEPQKMKDMERTPTIKILPLSWFHRNKTLREIAAIAVKSAAQVKPPPRELIDRRLYLNTLDQQIRQLSLSSSTTLQQPPQTVAVRNVAVTSPPEFVSSDATLSIWPPPDIGEARTTALSVSATGQLFFPNSDRTWWQKVLSFSSKRRTIGNGIRTMRRTLAQQYNALKRQGRAGLISYCLFNFLYYTIGIVWQWPRMPTMPITAADGSDVVSNLLSSSSPILSLAFLQNPQWTIPTLLLRKFGKIFAYLYAFSQLLKIPKLCSAVGLAPFSSKALDFVQRRCNVKETSATIILISSMVLLWGIIIAVPILSEFATLKHALFLEEQLMQGVYGLQPA